MDIFISGFSCENKWIHSYVHMHLVLGKLTRWEGIKDSLITDELILMTFYTVLEYDLRVCMKVDNLQWSKLLQGT